MSHPTAEQRLTHVLRHLDAVCTIPATARPGYDELAPVRIPLPTEAAETFFRAFEPLPPVEQEVHWLHVCGEKVPCLFDGDIVGSIFYWLSGWQETYSPERDRFGRFPYAASLQARLGCVTLPVADLLLEILRRWLEDASGIAIVRHPPRPALAVSHDVDHLRGGWRTAVKHQWRNRRPMAALLTTVKRLFGQAPFDNLVALAEIVRAETGLSSTFYLLGAQGKHALGPNADYELTSSYVQRRIRELEAVGCEIGLHASFGTATDATQLRAELEKLPHLTAGVRFHFLCFDPVLTPDILHRAGATHDATLGFAERAGFRHGTAHPFWLYDFTRQRTHRIICHPLHVMDVTFANPNYQPIAAAQIPAYVAELAKSANLCGGTLSLLWHNEYVVPGEATLGEDTFRNVLRRCREIDE